MTASPNANAKITAEPLSLDGLLLLQPKKFGDDRGFLQEAYNARAFGAAGIQCEFVQDNHSRSVRHTLRGLHYQAHPGQAKLVRVARGQIWDVAVDIRPDSPTFGQWQGVDLDDQRGQQLFIPVGFAHGFCVLSDEADVIYKLSTYYDPSQEMGFAWDDPEVGVAWPVTEPLLSARDAQAESFATLRQRLAAQGPSGLGDGHQRSGR